MHFDPSGAALLMDLELECLNFEREFRKGLHLCGHGAQIHRGGNQVGIILQGLNAGHTGVALERYQPES